MRQQNLLQSVQECEHSEPVAKWPSWLQGLMQSWAMCSEFTSIHNDDKMIFDLLLSRIKWLSKLRILPLVLMQSCRKSSNAAMTLMPFSTGRMQSIVLFFLFSFIAEMETAFALVLVKSIMTEVIYIYIYTHTHTQGKAWIHLFSPRRRKKN